MSSDQWTKTGQWLVVRSLVLINVYSRHSLNCIRSAASDVSSRDRLFYIPSGLKEVKQLMRKETWRAITLAKDKQRLPLDPPEPIR
ncbi:MAG TPA: hypothetical protein V6D11_28110 [Waterburya sp.]